VPLLLAADPVAVAVEAVRVRVGNGVDHAEVAVGDVVAVEVWRRRRDAHVGVARMAVPRRGGGGGGAGGRGGGGRVGSGGFTVVVCAAVLFARFGSGVAEATAAVAVSVPVAVG
jgi:hypothetical protein